MAKQGETAQQQVYLTTPGIGPSGPRHAHGAPGGAGGARQTIGGGSRWDREEMPRNAGAWALAAVEAAAIRSRAGQAAEAAAGTVGPKRRSPRRNAIINAKVSLRMSSLLATSAADCHKPSCSQASTPLGKHRAMLSQVQKHLPSRSPAERDDVAA
ncbi:hypothetical protein BRDID11002_11000 [Bradyrhizobium diazoefficiens]